MDSYNHYEILEECLRQVQAGKSLDEALAPYGSLGEELRPLLETAVIASILRPARDVPVPAQNRSRARFLAAAGEARARPANPWFNLLPRLSAGVLLRVAIIALLLTGLLGTGLTSAKSIPGDTLYPVKIAVEKARLSLAPDPESRLALEQTFDQERVEESHQVLQLGRSQYVSFAGYLEREDGDEWEVGKIHLILTPEQAAQAAGLENLYVDVEGHAAGEQMLVNTLRVRLFEFTGTIERAESRRLTISGVRVEQDERTQLRLQPATGKTVRVTAVQQKNGDLIALLVVPAETPGETVTYQPLLSPTALPTAVFTFPTSAPHEQEFETEAPKPEDEVEIEDTPEPEEHIDETPQPDDGGDEQKDDHKDDEHSDEDHHEDDSKSGDGGSDH